MRKARAKRLGNGLNVDEQARREVRTWLAAHPTLTQNAVAAKIGRDQGWLSRYLQGEFDADLTTLKKLADVFGVTLAQLLDLPADPVDADVLAMFHALPADARANVLGLLKILSRRS